MPLTLTQNKPRYEGVKVTREEYLDLDEDGYKYDMIQGVLTMAPSPHFEHNELEINFAVQLKKNLTLTNKGRVSVETDVFLPDGGDVLRPDISFILHENMGIVKTHIHGTPDLVCEVLSNATRRRDLGEKADRYLKNGVKEYWILDPVEKTMELWLNRGAAWEKKSGRQISSELLPGFEVKSEDIFIA